MTRNYKLTPYFIQSKTHNFFNDFFSLSTRMLFEEKWMKNYQSLIKEAVKHKCLKATQKKMNNKRKNKNKNKATNTNDQEVLWI